MYTSHLTPRGTNFRVIKAFEFAVGSMVFPASSRTPLTVRVKVVNSGCTLVIR